MASMCIQIFEMWKMDLVCRCSLTPLQRQYSCCASHVRRCPGSPPGCPAPGAFCGPPRRSRRSHSNQRPAYSAGRECCSAWRSPAASSRWSSPCTRTWRIHWHYWPGWSGSADRISVPRRQTASAEQ